MHELRRPVQFQDVDAAGIVFFACFFTYAHDAMVSLFDTIQGGYAGFINDKKVGFPAVHAEADFRAPLRFGDIATIRVTATRIGQKSATLRFEMLSKEVACAVVTNTVVMTDLVLLKGVALTTEVRALLQAHHG